MFQEHRILVTGADTGVGLACASYLERAGAVVFRHVGPMLPIEDTPDRGVTADFSSQEGLQAICDFVREISPLSGIVNNAAAKDRGNIYSITPERFFSTMGVNALAPLLIIKAALARSAGKGTPLSVVNIGSTNALGGDSNQLVYSMSKAAMAAMTKNLANSLASFGVRVNQLNLGWIPTENEIALKIAEGLPEGWPTNVPEDCAPIGRLTSETEACRHIAFWLSEMSAPANGVVYELEQFPMTGRLVPLSVAAFSPQLVKVGE